MTLEAPIFGGTGGPDGMRGVGSRRLERGLPDARRPVGLVVRHLCRSVARGRRPAAGGALRGPHGRKRRSRGPGPHTSEPVRGAVVGRRAAAARGRAGDRPGGARGPETGPGRPVGGNAGAGPDVGHGARTRWRAVRRGGAAPRRRAPGALPRRDAAVRGAAGCRGRAGGRRGRHAGFRAGRCGGCRCCRFRGCWRTPARWRLGPWPMSPAPRPSPPPGRGDRAPAVAK